METDRPGAETAGVLDIGGGNRFTISDVLAMKSAKEGLEREVGVLKETNSALHQELEKANTSSYSVNQSRIQSDSAREAAETRSKALEAQIGKLVQPDAVTKLQERVDLLTLEKYDGKIKSLAGSLKQDPSIFHGKSVEEIEIWEQILKMAPQSKTDPTIDRTGAGSTSPSATAHEANLEMIRKAREK